MYVTGRGGYRPTGVNATGAGRGFAPRGGAGAKYSTRAGLYLRAILGFLDEIF